MKKEDDKQKVFEVIFFDTETNGLEYYASVLSISAIKCLVDLTDKTVKEKEIFERFYYPVEEYNEEATDINKLTEWVVNKKRKGTTYPKHFKDDMQSFFDFCDGIDYYVAHNINFDARSLDKELPNSFCTMASNTDIVKAGPLIYGYYKWPKLSEAADYYDVETDYYSLHDGMYDTKVVVEIFRKMLYHPEGLKRIENFLYKIEPTFEE